MRLDQLQLTLRRRSPWEALDLGLVMLRQWRGPVYRVWLASFVSFSLVLTGLLWQWPWLTMLIVWWLKPLFDRLLLKVFAEASFGAAPSVRDVWRALPGLLRHSGLIAGLTYRRFSVHRSFDLPVWQLEGQRGKAARARLRVLGRKTSGHAFWLTFVCAHIVVIFQLGLISMLDIMTPSDGLHAMSWADLVAGDLPEWAVYAYTLAWIAAESIVEPFFVAAGFSLYLNRRSELEGWDIEVAFRRMSARLVDEGRSGGQAISRVAMIAATTLSLALLSVQPGTAQADPSDSAADEASPVSVASAPAARPDGKIKQVAERVLADPVFGRKIEETTWRMRRQEAAPDESGPPWWAEYLLKMAGYLATGVRGIIYLLLGLALVALLVLIYRNRHRFITGGRAGPPSVPEALFGLDLRPASLPDDIAAAALAELERGQVVVALSLLYRGALIRLIRHQHIEFRDGDTEDTCLRRASGRIDAQAAAYFAALLDAWKRAAYAETPPDAASTRDLCVNWRRHFGEQGAAA